MLHTAMLSITIVTYWFISPSCISRLDDPASDLERVPTTKEQNCNPMATEMSSRRKKLLLHAPGLGEPPSFRSIPKLRIITVCDCPISNAKYAQVGSTLYWTLHR